MAQAEITELLSGLQSNEDATRKLAVFKLQTSINDPSAADLFISSDGLKILRQMIMTAGGNTLAYALTALSRMLEVDMGWEIFELDGAEALIERLLQLIVTHPLVNILRGSMSVLVAVVSHSQSSKTSNRAQGTYGLRALTPALAIYPEFFEMVVSQLQSADHLLCANSLMLLNALIRDSFSLKGPNDNSSRNSNELFEDWTAFVKKLEDLGIVQAAFELMQSSSFQDLTFSLIEFQAITKAILKKRRDIKVKLKNPEHQKMLEKIYLAGFGEDKQVSSKGDVIRKSSDQIKEKHENSSPDKWQKLGFLTKNLATEFNETGFLGLIDLAHFVETDKHSFQKSLEEQAAKPVKQRCPLVRASISVTEILYEYFEICQPNSDDHKNHLSLDRIKNHDSLIRPFILKWPLIHAKALNAFVLLWNQTRAEQEDFGKVAELVRTLIDKILGAAARTKDFQEIEEEFSQFDHLQLRIAQIEKLNMKFESEWSEHLSQIRAELRNDALQFMKEQRIRTLLQGAWFPLPSNKSNENVILNEDDLPPKWRYVKLSQNRRCLHYDDFECQANKEPLLDRLNQKIDLGIISSVDSNITIDENKTNINRTPVSNNTTHGQQTKAPTISIIIKSFASALDNNSHEENDSNTQQAEKEVLTLIPPNQILASAWFDGLLMLLNQAPITPETQKHVALICEYGLKIRLLNVRLDELMNIPDGAGVVPSRDGLDENYFYEI